MLISALLLAFFLMGAVRLAGIQSRHLILLFVFPLKVLVSEMIKFGMWNWRGLLCRQGSIPVSDLKLCKKILIHPAWPDRVKPYSLLHVASFGKPLGLTFGCGKEYEEARRMASKILKDVGFYNTFQLQKLVEPEVSRLLSTLTGLSRHKPENDKGFVWCPTHKFNDFVVAITWRFLFGRKLPKDDVTIAKFLSYLEAGNQKFKIRGLGWAGASSLVSKLVGPWCLLSYWYTGSNLFYRAAKEIIHERRANPAMIQGSTNFLDAYLLNFGATKNSGTTDEQLVVVLRDLVAGTGGTVAGALEFAILHIALNPSVQEELQAEVDQVVDPSRRPLYSDRHSMPYTQATILEILRHGSVISPGERVAVDDHTIDGVFYPKGTVVAIKQYDIHQSREIWEDPGAFRPSRFLNAESGRVENKGKIIPFGCGRRFCIGESLAQVSLFMFLAALMQEFSFEVPGELPPPSLATVSGQSRSPVPFFVRVVPRR